MSRQDWMTPTTDHLRAALGQVVDPEIGLDIVALGLVYDVRPTPGRVEVDLTMTTPSCPMSSMILADVRRVLGAALPPGTEVAAQLVWQPPWAPEMMSEQARRHLGWS